jgi:RNA polymerase sigma-70 factor (ECF subfamily)
MARDDDCLPLPEEAADDAALAVLAARGCTGSFAVLTARHHVAIVHYARRLLARRGGPRAGCDAEDVVQETFLRAWRELGRYDPRYTFSTWLFTIGRRACLNHLRGERRHADRLSRAARDRETDHAASISGDETAGGAANSLWGLAARTLSERQFTALWLRYVEEMPAAGIARVLASTTVGARLTLMRARRRLETEMRSAAVGSADRTAAVTPVPIPLLRPLPPPAS